MINEMMKQRWMDERNLRQTTSHPCPRRLIGKVCSRYRQWTMCECEQFGLGQGLLDHPYGFYSPENPRVLDTIVCHAYNVRNGVPASLNELAMLNGLCQALRLGYKILPADESWYYPGQTHMIVIRRLRQSNSYRLLHNPSTGEVSWEPRWEPGFYQFSNSDEFSQ